MTDALMLDVDRDPVASRDFSAGPCEERIGHAHNYHHRTVVTTGAVRVYHRRPGEDEWGESIVFKEGEDIFVAAELEHRIESVHPEPGSAKADAIEMIRSMMKSLGVERWELAERAEWKCIFAHRDAADGLGVETYRGHDAAYE